MLAITANVIAFYLGTVFFERAGIVWGVIVFLFTAFGGTIICTMIEERLRFQFSKVSRPRHGGKEGRPAATLSML